MATATEHNQIADGQLVTDAEHNHWTRNVTFSIGSIKIRTDVSNAHTRRVLLVLEQEVHSRIHNEISEDELVQISCATEQKYSCIPDWHYQKKAGLAPSKPYHDPWRLIIKPPKIPKTAHA